MLPAEISSWCLAWSENAFVPPEDSDAFAGAGYALSPADCEQGVAREPVTDLPFAGERPFWIRSPDRKEIVIVHLLHAEAEGGPVTVTLSRYTRAG
ncbi:hypothetical protein ACIQMO_27630 [Streptomyces sp. NPDC091406]|uniref:hypothetical protein n=1 Tax=unclassified Streptomyces TaxID=2593676 RepID=UPI00381E5175